MGNKEATTGANLVEDKIETTETTTDTKFVKEMLEKIEYAEDKNWCFLARVLISIEEEGGIEEIKKRLINTAIDLMGFGESEFVFSRINEDRDKDGNPFSDSVQVIFVLPNSSESVFCLQILELYDLKKVLYLKYLNFVKIIGVQQNEKNK